PKQSCSDFCAVRAAADWRALLLCFARTGTQFSGKTQTKTRTDKRHLERLSRRCWAYAVLPYGDGLPWPAETGEKIRAIRIFISPETAFAMNCFPSLRPSIPGSLKRSPTRLTWRARKRPSGRAI